MEPHLVVVVSEWRVELVRPMDATAIDDHDDLFAGLAEGGHHLMEILAQLLRIKVRHDCREDFRGPIVDGADNAEQHATRDAAPGVILEPRLAFEVFCAFDLTLAQWAYREASALDWAPP